MVSGSCANTPSPDRFRPMLASLPTLLCEQSRTETVHAIQYCAIGLVGVINDSEKLCANTGIGSKTAYLVISNIEREEARETWNPSVNPEGLSKDEVKS